jgi:hypothetical protein
MSTTQGPQHPRDLTSLAPNEPREFTHGSIDASAGAVDFEGEQQLCDPLGGRHQCLLARFVTCTHNTPHLDESNI